MSLGSESSALTLVPSPFSCNISALFLWAHCRFESQYVRTGVGLEVTGTQADTVLCSLRSSEALWRQDKAVKVGT